VKPFAPVRTVPSLVLVVPIIVEAAVLPPPLPDAPDDPVDEPDELPLVPQAASKPIAATATATRPTRKCLFMPVLLR
jgi:hypothetical protein